MPATTTFDDRSRLSAMRRVCVAMLVGGGLTSAVGVWTTQQASRSQVAASVVSVLFVAGGIALALLDPPRRRRMEAAAFVSMAAIGVLIATSDPLGMTPVFFLWPVVLLSHLSSPRTGALGFAASTALLAAGLALNDSAILRVDTFIGTTVLIGVMAWLIASLTANQARLRAELATAAATDPLTGLLNRRAFHPMLDALVEEAVTDGDRLVLVMDLDHVKAVDDQHGHTVGDEALRHGAHGLLAHAREHDLVARLGGEEFAVALPGATMELGRAYVAEVSATIADVPQPVGSLATSAGLSSLDDATTSPDELLVRADRALYGAKLAGRNRPAAWEPHGIVVGAPFSSIDGSVHETAAGAPRPRVASSVQDP